MLLLPMPRFTMLQKSFHTDFRKYSLGFVKRVGNQTIEQPRQERLSEVFIPFTHRKYDITYIGVTASGSDRELYGVNEHRMMAINAMKSIKTRHPHLNVYVGLWKMSYPHFIEVLKGRWPSVVRPRVEVRW